MAKKSKKKGAVKKPGKLTKKQSALAKSRDLLNEKVDQLQAEALPLGMFALTIKTDDIVRVADERGFRLDDGGISEVAYGVWQRLEHYLKPVIEDVLDELFDEPEEEAEKEEEEE